MELKVEWTHFAKGELKRIFFYYKLEVNITIAKKIISGIVDSTLKLKTQPSIGQVEELLKNDTREFRYLVYQNFKIIYLVALEDNSITIYDVFDTRQNPVKMSRSN